MFEFPHVLVVVALVLMTVAYFVLMADKWNLKLLTFLIVSLVFTVAFTVLSTLIIPSFLAVFGVFECLLYDIGSLIHFARGKRTVRQVTQKK